MQASHPKLVASLAAALVLASGLALELLLDHGPLARALAGPLPPVASGAILTAEEPGLEAFLFSSVDVPLQCADGIDNDGDGSIDLADRGCVDAFDLWEEDPVKARRRDVSVRWIVDGLEVGYVRVNGLSDDGSTAVGVVYGPNWNFRSNFRWDNGVFELIEDPVPGGFSTGWRAADTSVSGDGRVVVASGLDNRSYPRIARSYRFEDGVRSEVPPVNGGALVNDLDDDGTTMVGWVGDENEATPARWDDGIVTLLESSGRSWRHFAWGVSGDGQVAVGMVTRAAVRWLGLDPSARFLEDDAPPGDPGWPGDQSVAVAASRDGSVIVGTNIEPWPTRNAYRWEAGVLTDLGDGEVLDVSADGRIAVGWGPSIWDASGNQRNLTDLLVNDYRVGLNGWELHAATAISGDGRTVAGLGRDPDGNSDAWIVELPAACHDGLDNDGDGLVDFGDDPGCPTRLSDSEDVACAIGFELALLLPPLLWLRRRPAQRVSR